VSNPGTVLFEPRLEEFLPRDIPERAGLIAAAAHHLARIAENNQQFNLTRITGETEAVVKHVLDSVVPWRLFAGATHVADVGTGAGFPGIPLARVFPDQRFTLLESTRKKARFVESVVAELGLTNATVRAERAEEWLAGTRPDIITARAVAPLSRAASWFGPAIRNGSVLLLYKGPDADTEVEQASDQLRRAHLTAKVRLRYELPEGMGSRSILEVRQVDRSQDRNQKSKRAPISPFRGPARSRD
jgi:16S rRNA (guanine527-N7)-methyltransferase